MKLGPDEICLYSDICPFADKKSKDFFCRGTITRDHQFTCELVDEKGNFVQKETRRISEGES